jgi:hypothetical protein
MKTELNEFQFEVLKEFIENAKSDSCIKTANFFEKQLEYDFVHGEGESIELLNKYFYDLISEEALTKPQIKQLAKDIIRRENKWEFVNDLSQINFDDVIEDGFGYVILSSGIRVDIGTDMYMEERKAFNAKRASKLQECKTNGTEYLR